MKEMQALFLSLLLLAVCTPTALSQPTLTAAPQTPCQWAQPAEIIQQGPQELHQLWRFVEAPVLWSPVLPSSPSFTEFRQQVQALIPELDPRRYYQTHPPAPEAEAYNQVLGASGRAGELQPIRCLEALLLSEQTARLPMLTQPSEFGAFILRRQDPDGVMHYRVYFSTQDQPGLRMNAQVMNRIAADREAGWRVWAHLHNHNFFPEKADPFASPSPSKTDIAFARMLRQSLNLENLWVTNGFHTLHLTQREFYLFQGHSES
ncbi:MAG: hypothetical protein ACO1RX_18810 [Candidatus Sericytochromatia bacterium]